MEIIYRKLSELKPNPKNPRQSTKDAVEKLAESIKANPKFFEARPILLSDRTGELVIIGGERRSEAAALLGMKTVPTILIPGLTEAKEDEILIKDNTHAGVWDEQKLAMWGKEQLQGWNVEGVKWPKQEQAIKEDDFNPDKQVEKRCNPGDIWQLGDHRLMCGDSTDLETVKKLMGGGLADMIFTDPPYGVSYTDKNEFLNRIGKPIGVPNPIENDSKSPEEMNIFWKQVFGNLAEITKDDAAYYVTSPQGGDLLLLLLAIRETPFALKHTLIWNKNNHILGRCDYNYKHEPIIYGWKKKGTHHFYGAGKFKTSVWDIDKPLKNDLHPTMKPVELVANCLLDCTKEGDSVVDVFGGSGTTLIAAEQLKRRCYMMELDPHYCDVIISRWETFTGKTAQLITPGDKVS